jgi:septum formation protein
VIHQPTIEVILASASPRRKELLEQLGLKFCIIPAHIDEDMLENEMPIQHVCRLSQEKAEAIANQFSDAIIISSDTIVVFQDKILGKPSDLEDAKCMLKMLSGNSHQVITAFSILSKKLNIHMTEYEITEVHFRELHDQDILDYVATGSPMDKAGAYGIQDINAYLVDSIHGSYQNVMGFPVAHFATSWNKLFNTNT